MVPGRGDQVALLSPRVGGYRRGAEGAVGRIPSEAITPQGREAGDGEGEPETESGGVIPVEQTRLGYPDGNCFAACAASVFELPLTEVPDECAADFEKFDAAWLAWLKARGFSMLTFPAGEGPFPAPWMHGYMILAADSPRVFTPDGEPRKHAVVIRHGHIVWDPHPGREQPVGTWRDVTIFYSLNPQAK